MKYPKTTSWTAPTARRTIYACGAVAALLVSLPLLCTGCDDKVADEFRAAALGSVEAGVKSVADGILTGIFTIADPGSDSSTDPNSTSDGTETATSG